MGGRLGSGGFFFQVFCVALSKARRYCADNMLVRIGSGHPHSLHEVHGTFKALTLCFFPLDIVEVGTLFPFMENAALTRLQTIVLSPHYSTRYAEAKRRKLCVLCQKSTKSFRDRSAELEYEISAICQECQDALFKGENQILS